LIAETDNAGSNDPGLAILVMLLRFHGVSADPQQLRHQFGQEKVSIAEMLRCAKEFGLKARSYRTTWERLATTPLPGIAVLRDASFLLIAKVHEDQVLVQAPLSPRPSLMTRAQLEAIWAGQLVLMARRVGLVDLSRRFDITWFLGAIHHVSSPSNAKVDHVCKARHNIRLLKYIRRLKSRGAAEYLSISRPFST
jgi:ATP-binding cassette, subfamily B, bacterial HlyB/CyaB